MFCGSKSRRSFGPYDVIFGAIVLKRNIVYKIQMSQNTGQFHLPATCGFCFVDQNVQNLTKKLKNSFFGGHFGL